MMPLGDDDTGRKAVPLVTYILIALNVLFFFVEMSGGENFIIRWAFVPARFKANPVGEFPTIFTAMFMHAGLGHLIGNMLYLWIFGDNVEDRFGRVKFLIFYIICGIAATFAQYALNSNIEIPNLGASGAIAGVLGAYIVLFPGTKVNVLLGRSVVAMPSLIVIGFWFVLQFLSGIGSLSQTEGEGGVAYLAHIGGFIAGLLLTPLFRAQLGTPR